MNPRWIVLKGIKRMIKALLTAVDKISPESDAGYADDFLKWLKEVADGVIVGVQDSGAKQHLTSMKRLGLFVGDTDEYFREAMIAFAVKMRQTRAPPITDEERKLIRQRFGVEV